MKKIFFLLITISFLAVLVSCEKEPEPVDNQTIYDFAIVKSNPSGFSSNDGTLEIVFNEKDINPEITWTKEDYSRYKYISNDYFVDSLSGGMYYVEFIVNDTQLVRSSVFLASYDTIYPKSYFPVYPNSYWVYDNGYKIECASEYKLIGLKHEYEGLYQTHNPHNNPVFPVDSIYVPSFNGKHMFGYSVIEDYQNELMRYLPIVNEGLGYFEKVEADPRYDFTYSSLLIKSVDTTVTINNTKYENVIVAEHFQMPTIVEEDAYDRSQYYLYFAKDIGLIQNKKYYTRWADTLHTQRVSDSTIISLVEYHIGK